MPDFASVTRPRLEATLESDETLEGGLRRHPAEHLSREAHWCWASIGPAVLDSAAVTIQLKTAGGDKHKLSLVWGTGVFGKLGGGEAQQEGIEALAGWFQRFARQAQPVASSPAP